MTADFKLTPTSVPPRAAGRRPAAYLQMLTDFTAMGAPSARVDYGRKPDTIYNGLATALRKHPEIKGVSVTRRGNEIFLVRRK